MENTLPQAISTAELGPVKGTGATPFSQQTVVLTKQTYIELKWKANYWQAQYERLVEREATLKTDVEALQATIRDFKQILSDAKQTGRLTIIVQRSGILRRIDVHLEPYTKTQIDKIVAQHLAQSHSMTATGPQQ